MGICRHFPGDRAVPVPVDQVDKNCRTTTVGFQQDLWLWGSVRAVLPFCGEYRHDHRTATGDRDPPAILQLRRFIPLGLYHILVHPAPPGCHQNGIIKIGLNTGLNLHSNRFIVNILPP